MRSIIVGTVVSSAADSKLISDVYVAIGADDALILGLLDCIIVALPRGAAHIGQVTWSLVLFRLVIAHISKHSLWIFCPQVARQ